MQAAAAEQEQAKNGEKDEAAIEATDKIAQLETPASESSVN